jgi:CubicO group peptidase (beta-lactamase class C family)
MKQAGLAAAGLTTLNGFTVPEEQKFLGLRKAIAGHAASLKIPGLAVAVVENGKVSFVQTEGFADLEGKVPVRRDHIFPVASLTKTFAAVTLMQYAQEGKISMDDYVLDYPFLSIGLSPDRLPNPNVQLKHVISHTSEGVPGSNFIYNGNRYNFVYGVFEKISGNTKHYDAFAEEVKKRIIQPLGMKDTLCGYVPNDRIVSTYKWDVPQQQYAVDKDLKSQNTLFPSAGLLTTLDDLAAYSNALDQNTILNAASYQKMTAPFTEHYGMGWATQEVGGKQVHWHYGYGDSYAAMIIRVPQDKLTFILLSNGVPASEAFTLGYGNVLNSVFAQAFFKSMFNTPLDNTLSEALLQYYTEQKYNAAPGKVEELVSKIQKPELSFINLLASLDDPRLKAQTEKAITAYQASKWFHPDIHWAVADWYARSGNQHSALIWYHLLADSEGYNEQSGVNKACSALGAYYMKVGQTAKGRIYLWRKALYACHLNPDAGVNNQLMLMKTK